MNNGGVSREFGAASAEQPNGMLYGSGDAIAKSIDVQFVSGRNVIPAGCGDTNFESPIFGSASACRASSFLGGASKFGAIQTSQLQDQTQNVHDAAPRFAQDLKTFDSIVQGTLIQGSSAEPKDMCKISPVSPETHPPSSSQYVPASAAQPLLGKAFWGGRSSSSTQRRQIPEKSTETQNLPMTKTLNAESSGDHSHRREVTSWPAHESGCSQETQIPTYQDASVAAVSEVQTVSTLAPPQSQLPLGANVHSRTVPASQNHQLNSNFHGDTQPGAFSHGTDCSSQVLAPSQKFSEMMQFGAGAVGKAGSPMEDIAMNSELDAAGSNLRSSAATGSWAALSSVKENPSEVFGRDSSEVLHAPARQEDEAAKSSFSGHVSTEKRFSDAFSDKRSDQMNETPLALKANDDPATSEYPRGVEGKIGIDHHQTKQPYYDHEWIRRQGSIFETAAVDYVGPDSDIKQMETATIKPVQESQTPGMLEEGRDRPADAYMPMELLPAGRLQDVVGPPAIPRFVENSSCHKVPAHGVWLMRQPLGPQPRNQTSNKLAAPFGRAIAAAEQATLPLTSQAEISTQLVPVPLPPNQSTTYQTQSNCPGVDRAARPLLDTRQMPPPPTGALTGGNDVLGDLRFAISGGHNPKMYQSLKPHMQMRGTQTRRYGRGSTRARIRVPYVDVLDPTEGMTYIMCSFCKNDKLYRVMKTLVRHMQNADCPAGRDFIWNAYERGENVAVDDFNRANAEARDAVQVTKIQDYQKSGFTEQPMQERGVQALSRSAILFKDALEVGECTSKQLETENLKARSGPDQGDCYEGGVCQNHINNCEAQYNVDNWNNRGASDSRTQSDFASQNCTSRAGPLPMQSVYQRKCELLSRLKALDFQRYSELSAGVRGLVNRTISELDVLVEQAEARSVRAANISSDFAAVQRSFAEHLKQPCPKPVCENGAVSTQTPIISIAEAARRAEDGAPFSVNQWRTAARRRLCDHATSRARERSRSRRSPSRQPVLRPIRPPSPVKPSNDEAPQTQVSGPQCENAPSLELTPERIKEGRASPCSTPQSVIRVDMTPDPPMQKRPKLARMAMNLFAAHRQFSGYLGTRSCIQGKSWLESLAENRPQNGLSNVDTMQILASPPQVSLVTSDSVVFKPPNLAVVDVTEIDSD